MPKVVKGHGNTDADIAFIGEAPGHNEEREGRPFVGASGRLFNSVLAKLGVLRKDVWVDNVCQLRPPRNNISKWIKVRYRGKPNEYWQPNRNVAQGMRDLVVTLASIDPTVIVPMGNTALWALTGTKSVFQRRGSIMPVGWDIQRLKALESFDLVDQQFVDALAAVHGKKVIVTVHPAFVLRKYEYLALFQTDLRRVIEDSKFSDLRLPERDIVIDPDETTLGEFMEELVTADRIAFDIECVGFRLFCCGFAKEPGRILVLTDSSRTNHGAIKTILESPVPKVAQNGLFDVGYLARHSGVDTANYRYDTMLAWHAAYPELPKGLATIGSVTTREPYYKDEGKDWSQKDAEDVQRFLEYNGKDVGVTLEAWNALEAAELQDSAYRRLHDRLIDQSAPYIDMGNSGLLVDQRRRSEHEANLLSDASDLQKALDETVLNDLLKVHKYLQEKEKEKDAAAVFKFMQEITEGVGTEQGGLNVNSPKMIQHYLYDIRGMKVKKDPKTKRPTVNEDALRELFSETGDPYLLTIIKIRQKRKRVSSFCRYNLDADGRVYWSVNPVKAKTGRSSTGKTTTGLGLNMQTVPHEMRDQFIPEPDYGLAYFDYSQAEARIVATYADVQRMVQAFKEAGPKYTPGDVHSLTAHHVLGTPYNEMQEYPHRFLGKTCNHAFNYEMGYIKFWRLVAKRSGDTGVILTRSEAKRMREKHFRAYPELEWYWQDIREKLRADRTLVNPFGRKRVFLGRLDNDTFREAYNHYAQSTVRDLVGDGMVRTYHSVIKPLQEDFPHTRIALEVHDALLIQYPLGIENELFPQIKKAMTIPIEVNGRPLTIPVDCEYGIAWEGEGWKKWHDEREAA